MQPRSGPVGTVLRARRDACRGSGVRALEQTADPGWTVLKLRSPLCCWWRVGVGIGDCFRQVARVHCAVESSTARPMVRGVEHIQDRRILRERSRLPLSSPSEVLRDRHGFRRATIAQCRGRRQSRVSCSGRVPNTILAKRRASRHRRVEKARCYV
jgi:hypothetical protein